MGCCGHDFKERIALQTHTSVEKSILFVGDRATTSYTYLLWLDFFFLGFFNDVLTESFVCPILFGDEDYTASKC